MIIGIFRWLVMNVLEIYPTFSWWLCGKDSEEIEELREAIRSAPTHAETNRKAYFLVGDAVAFELVSHAFDEIVVHYAPTPLKRLVLERHSKKWLNTNGALKFDVPPNTPAFGYVEDPGAEDIRLSRLRWLRPADLSV